MAKAVINWHSNTERIQKKEQERLEKERMKMLMNEDEEGYRKLVNEKKDQRLAFLLSQTDEYIDSLTLLVAQHQDELMKKKNYKPGKKGKAKAEMSDGGIRVVNSATGEVLEGEDAPGLNELDAWLDLNQGWEVVPREAEADEDENSKAEDENSNSNSEAVVAVPEERPEPKIGPDGELILPQVCCGLVVGYWTVPRLI